MYPPAPLRPNGLPDNHIACSDGDPTCDAGPPGDHECVFIFRACFNLIDLEVRFFCSASGPVTEARLANPPEGHPKTSVDVENRDAFEAAMMNLGATVSGFTKRSMLFNPPLAASICSGPIPVTLRLKQNPKTLVYSARKFRYNYRVFRASGRFDGDHLYLRCNP